MASARLRRAAAAVKSAEGSHRGRGRTTKRHGSAGQYEHPRAVRRVIVKKLAEIGEVVSPSPPPSVPAVRSVNMVDPLSVTVDAEVSEAMIHRVRPGSRRRFNSIRCRGTDIRARCSR